MKGCPRLLLCILLACPIFAAGAAFAAEPIPLRAFLTPAAYSQPRLSPDGTKLAMLVQMDKRQQIIVLDLATMKPRQVATANSPYTYLRTFLWKNNDTLILLVRRGEYRSLDLNTLKLDSLYRLNTVDGRIVDPLPNDPDHLLISVFGHSIDGAELRRMHLRTGQMTLVQEGFDYVRNWISDATGHPVAALGRDAEDRWFMLTRPSPSASWTRTALGQNAHPDFLPIAGHPDQRRLFGYDYTGDAIRTILLDPATGKKESLFEADGSSACTFEFWSANDASPRSICYGADRPQRFCTDKEATEVYAAIDAALPPGRFNTIVDADQKITRLLIHSRSDRTMGEYYLLDRATRHLTSLGPCQVGLPEQAMSPGRAFHYVARDGLKLSGRIVLPLGGTSQPPLILLIGPELNGPSAEWAFDEREQLFASRGYAVARLNYRGVPGFGKKTFLAGEKQMLGGMPNDLEDGVRWLVAQGWVAPRVAVLGDRSGALLAVQLAARPAPFVAWINFFGRDLEWLGDNLYASGQEEDPWQIFGGKKTMRRYVESLSEPLRRQQIRMPAFHLYGDDPNEDVVRQRAVGYSKRAGQPFVTHVTHDSVYLEKHYKDDYYTAAIEEDVASFTALLAFLDRYLPLATSASP